jgi:hypothetical protein
MDLSSLKMTFFLLTKTPRQTTWISQAMKKRSSEVQSCFDDPRQLNVAEKS